MSKLADLLFNHGILPGTSEFWHAEEAEERFVYVNVAIAPDGTLRPWRGVGPTHHPPVLRTDGQFIWLPRND
jgi:hypothetical protein